MYNLFNNLRPPNPTLFKLPCSFRPNNMDARPHFSRGIILKTQASVLVAGYTGVWKAEKYVCIKYTRCTWYCCKHQKNLSFLNFIQVEFFKEISHGECWKCYFWASRFQNVLEEHAPRPLQTLRLCYSFSSPPLENTLCRPTQWSPGLPSLGQYTHGINTHSKKALMLNKFGVKSS